MSTCIGIEIGGTKLQIVTGTASGEIARQHRFNIDRTAGAEGIRQQISLTLQNIQHETKIDAIGVGFGGPLDHRSGTTIRSHQIAGWDDFPLADWLREQAGTDHVWVDNDANTAALAEARHGIGRGHDTVAYLTLGSGAGGGLVQRGQIYHGGGAGEFEIGHLRLTLSGDTVESRCAGWAVNARIRALATDHPDSLLAELTRDSQNDEAKQLRPAIDRGDRLAIELLGHIAQDLAFALSHLTHIAHPNIIVIGGGLSLIGEPLRASVASQMPHLLMAAMRPGPQVALAALGEDVVPVGALLLAGQALNHTF